MDRGGNQFLITQRQLRAEHGVDGRFARAHQRNHAVFIHGRDAFIGGAIGYMVGRQPIRILHDAALIQQVVFHRELAAHAARVIILTGIAAAGETRAEYIRAVQTGDRHFGRQEYHFQLGGQLRAVRQGCRQRVRAHLAAARARVDAYAGLVLVFIQGVELRVVLVLQRPGNAFDRFIAQHGEDARSARPAHAADRAVRVQINGFIADGLIGVGIIRRALALTHRQIRLTVIRRGLDVYRQREGFSKQVAAIHLAAIILRAGNRRGRILGYIPRLQGYAAIIVRGRGQRGLAGFYRELLLACDRAGAFRIRQIRHTLNEQGDFLARIHRQLRNSALRTRNVFRAHIAIRIGQNEIRYVIRIHIHIDRIQQRDFRRHAIIVAHRGNGNLRAALAHGGNRSIRGDGSDLIVRRAEAQLQIRSLYRSVGRGLKLIGKLERIADIGVCRLDRTAILIAGNALHAVRRNLPRRFGNMNVRCKRRSVWKRCGQLARRIFQLSGCIYGENAIRIGSDMRSGLEYAAFHRPLIIAHFGYDLIFVYNRNFVFGNNFAIIALFCVIVDIQGIAHGDIFICARCALAIYDLRVRIFGFAAGNLHGAGREIHGHIYRIQRHEFEIRIGLRHAYRVIARGGVFAHLEIQHAKIAVFDFAFAVGIDQIVLAVFNVGNKGSAAEQIGSALLDRYKLKRFVIVFQLPGNPRKAGVIFDLRRYGKRIARLQRFRGRADERHLRRALRQCGEGGQNRREQHCQHQQNAGKPICLGSHFVLSFL